MSYSTPSQWEAFAQNMSDDIDKINERIYRIFNVKPPKTAHEPSRNTRGFRHPRKATTAAKSQRPPAIPPKTRQEIMAEFRQNDQDVPKTNYTALPVRNSNTPARIFRPKIYQNLPYSNGRDVTPVITGDTVNSNTDHHHHCENCEHCENCICEKCQN